MTNPIKKFFGPKLKLVRGTRFISFLFIGTSVLIAGAVLFAANMYYNIDTSEVVMEEVQRVTGVLRATAGVIVGGTASQDPTSGYAFEVVGKTRLSTTTLATGQLEFTGSDTYAGFKAPSSYGTGTAAVYNLPQHGTYTPQTDYVMTWQSGNQLLWKDVTATGGAGDVIDVGDCATGACFTADGAGNTLYFEGATADAYEIILTAVNPTADYTITLPAATGYVALGTSTAGYVAYWTATSTLAGEQYLATSRGGTGANTSAWNGMIKVVGGTWGTTTGTTNYAAYWSDANTVAAEQYLGVTRGGTGAGTFTQYGVIYGNGTSAFGVTAAGEADYLLVGSATTPAWKTISQLLTAGNNISLSGTTNVTIATVMNPTFSLSVTSPQFLSTTTLAVQSGDGQNITIDSASGKVVLASGDWIETNAGYQIGKSGDQVLREMIPIFGFDLPAQTATTSYVRVSRTLDNYPFSAAATGTTRVHRFVIRYTDNLPLASTTDWRVATTSGATYSTFTLPGRNNSALDSGWATTTGTVSIPADGTDWWLEVKSRAPYDTYKIKVFQIFLAAYDQLQ